MKKVFLSFSLAALFLATAPRSSADPLYTFGIDLSLGGGTIFQFEINGATVTPTELFVMPSIGESQTYNGLAINPVAADTGKSIIYLRNNSGGGDLLAWSPSFGLVTVATQAQMTAAGLNSQASNASLYAGRYWYVGQSTNTLNSTQITFDSNGVPNGIANTVSVTNFDGGTSNNYDFGDLVIASDGHLYGSRTGFAVDGTTPQNDYFRVNVDADGTLSATPDYAEADLSRNRLQTALFTDGSDRTIYGFDNSNSRWYTITNPEATTPTQVFLANGSLLGDTGTSRINDLVDVVVTYSIPEPSTYGVIIGSLGAMAFIARRKKLAA